MNKPATSADPYLKKDRGNPSEESMKAHGCRGASNGNAERLRRASSCIVLQILASVIVVFGIGCGSSLLTTSPVSGPSPSSSESTEPAPGSLGTIEVTNLHLVWSPAESPPANDAEAISSYLRSNNLVALLPSPVLTQGSSSAEFRAYSHAPSGEITLVVSVRIDNDPSPLLSLSTYSKPPNTGIPGRIVTVRGVQGVLKLVPEAVSFLQWQEHNQTFVAEFTTSDCDQVISWLSQWRVVP